MSEFFLLQDSYTDTLLIYSGVDTIPIIYDPGTWYPLFDPEKGIYECYDYDLDGEDEICVCKESWFDDTKIFYWFHLDKENGELILEQNFEHAYIHEPSYHYPAAFSDINGDQLPDAIHVYGHIGNDSVHRYHLEVNFGIDTSPYFSPAVDIEIGIEDRLLYPAGDFNGDGADDWYSKCHPDSMVVFFGNQNIIESGVDRQTFFQGNGQLYLPKSHYYSMFELCYKPPLTVLDYNMDGINDIYLNYWSFDENLQYETIGTGVVLGGITPDFENPEIIGRTGNETFRELEYGYSSKKIGDMNQDGFDDWGILAKTGCYLEVYFGGDELDMDPDITYYLPQTNKANCFDWTMGDLNGDGWTDIAISNSSVSSLRFVRTYMAERNEVYIFLGVPSLQAEYSYEDADVVLYDNNTFREFGKNLSIIGDYNADGFDDLVLGGGSHREYYPKEAFVYFGGNEIGPEPDIVLSRPSYSSYAFADPITPCGDINGDGHDDFTLGDPNNGFGYSLIYYGGPNADDQIDNILSNPDISGMAFGRSTPRTAGDFDGDGFPDLIQYSYFLRTFYIYKGGTDFNNTYDYTIYDSTFPVGFSCIEYIDRMAEIGRSDLALSIWSGDDHGVYIYSGGDLPGQEREYVLKNDLYRTGITVASGDFNNDGITEIFAGIPYENNYGYSGGGIVNYYRLFATVSVDDEMIGEEGISIFPNPASSNLNIEMQINEPGQVGIKLFDLKGNLLHQEARNIRQTGTHNILVNLDDFPPGVYVMEINQGNSVKRKKIILAK
jgi:hypothetical protein